jgi:hypothetical protein
MYSYWAEELELDAFVLGQLVGRKPGLDSHGALNILVSQRVVSRTTAMSYKGVLRSVPEIGQYAKLQ